MPHQAFDAIINPHGDAPSYAASITPIVRPNQDLPQPPLGTWGPGFPYPDQGLPQPPLGTWGPNDPRPSQPIWWEGYPAWPPVSGTPGDPPVVIWGPEDPRPTPPIALPIPPGKPIPPRWLITLPGPGEPGSPSNPYPPGGVPAHPSTGLNTFYMVIPYVGVVGPFSVPPGAGSTPAPSP